MLSRVLRLPLNAARYFPIILMFLCFTGAAAEAPRELPEPLTLKDALGFAREAHPLLAESLANRRRAEAGLALAEADDNLSIGVDARLRFIDPARLALDQSSNDSGIGILVEKRLYDAGRTASAIRGARLALAGRQLEFVDSQRQRYLDILAAYFDVLLADLTYIRDNEAMSIQFVRLDKQRNAHELGRVSDLALARAEDDYQRVRARRAASESNQRLARQRLASLLNRPDSLPSDLEMLEIRLGDRPVPDFEALLARALENNPRLLALRRKLASAVAAVDEARNAYAPEVNARLRAGAWHRDSGSRHPLSAELSLAVPLHTGGRRSAAIAEARADVSLARARLAGYRLRLREELLEQVLAISRLKVSLERQNALADRTDLELDQSRALYEMEVNSDLGDAMVNVSAARLEASRVGFDLALAWLRLKLLTGEELDEKRIEALLAGNVEPLAATAAE